METKDAAVRDELYEEAQLLRRRQQDYKSELVGLPGDGSSLPVVRSGDIEAVVAAWSGVPVERLTEDEMAKLTRLVSGAGARCSGFGLSWSPPVAADILRGLLLALAVGCCAGVWWLRP